MRAHLMILILTLATSGTVRAADAMPDDVLAAIAADAAAGSAPPPMPSSPAESATAPAGLRSQAIDNTEPAQAVALEPRAVCSLRDGERWQKQAELTLEQCAAALESDTLPYDAHGLRHAYWDGTFLSASTKAIYQSPNGQDWTKLRDRGAP